MKRITDLQHLFLPFFLCTVLSIPALGQKIASDVMAKLDRLISKWSIIATEEASDYASFREAGFQECSSELNHRVIRREVHVLRGESSGPYAAGPESRTLIVYYGNNVKDSCYALTWIRPNGNFAQPLHTSVEDNLSASWSFQHPLGEEVLIIRS